ncbi:unnamed protein product [Hymenolepis diminuta]|uniref:Uncharacterized protein n=1 Tax=Hymenolepis diminuta TaxID=6216 RepID=A0A564YAT8_HYMDI|nr:unnamed protein product [Hymenolepis diminuta]
MREPKLEFSRRPHKGLMTEVAKELQSYKRDNSEPDPPQTDCDDPSSKIVIPEMEFDT